MEKKITIVDKDDNVIGATTKAEALDKGLIRRVARIFLLDNGKVFLQKRGANQLIFPGRWDQSVGGHVDAGENYLEAAKRELGEELGLKDIELKELGKYYAESELEHNRHGVAFSTVYVAKYINQKITLQASEISGGKWVKASELSAMIKANPNDFTRGLIISWEKFGDKIQSC